MLSYGQQFEFEQVDSLIEQEKYNSAFELLNKMDPEQQDPEVVLQKTDVALKYFVKSISHQLFAFKDLDDDDDLLDLRESGDGESFSMYMFPVNEILDTLLIQFPKKYELNRALGNFYYEVHLKYGQNWLMEEPEVLELMYENCKIAVDNGVSDYLTQYCIGYYHVLQEDYNQAISPFLKSIELDTTYPTSYYNLSICYLYTDQADKGTKYAVRSIALYDDTSYKSDASRVAAALYKQAEDFDNAVKYYKLSDEIQPNNYYTINQLLELQLDLGLLNDALKTADSFFELDPKNPRTCSDLVEIYTITDQEQELLDLFERKIEEYNSDKEIIGNIYFHIGEYYRRKEEKIKAKENFLEAKKCFGEVFEKDHYVFQIIEEALND